MTRAEHTSTTAPAASERVCACIQLAETDCAELEDETETGKPTMTSQEMMHTPCKPGYWWQNVAAIGQAPDWRMVVAPHSTDGKLFGYEEKAFLAKQYR